MLAVCLFHAQRMSTVIDGSRYYFLDDDQMISMRYARNLAEGRGLVWNAGEHVEGYTNFGWVLVMAAVHAAGAPDRTASLVVKLIACVLAAFVLLLTDKLLSRLAPERSWWIAATCLTTLAMSVDLLFWTVNGFETPLLTVFFLWALLRGLDDVGRGTLSAATCVLAGLLPLIRSDAADLTLVVLTAVVWLGARRRLWTIALAGVPIALHLAFRLSYYGDWLPNTYYLKVAGRSGLALGALGYMKGFVAAYPVLVVLACWAALSADRRLRPLLATMAIVGAAMLVKGADMFSNHRFIAPLLPVLLVIVGAGLARIEREQSTAPVLAIVLLVSTLFTAGVNGRETLRDLESPNGLPRVNTVTGVLIDRYTAPDARILVAAAGAVGYFSHRTAIDMLGKTDREIAHSPPHPGAPTGHDHFDVDRSLARRPDLIVTFGSQALAEHAAAETLASGDLNSYGFALLRNATFVARYRSNPIPVPYLSQHNALFVRDDSPELAHVRDWREPRISP